MQTPSSPGAGPRFYVSRAGARLGEFPLDEIRRRRAAGQFDGTELLWREGMPAWLPINEALAAENPNFGPPPLPSRAKTGPGVGLWIGIGALVLFVAGLAAAGYWGWTRLRAKISTQALSLASFAPPPDGLEYAGPVTVSAGTRSIASRRPAEREFRVRHYVEAFKREGLRQPEIEADAAAYLDAWLAVNFEETTIEAEARFEETGGRLLAAAELRDPILVSILASNSVPSGTGRRAELLERAAKAYRATSRHAYPRFCTLVMLATQYRQDAARVSALDTEALEALAQAVRDGTLPPSDQEILADNLVAGWGEAFFSRQGAAVCELFAGAGEDWAWLSHLLAGDRHITLAWRARGGGYSNTVGAEGWKGFEEELTEARPELMRAWTLHPERPLAAARLIAVSMGQSDLRELRRWFERALDAQIDHRGAWSAMRWALRPRWFGSHEAMIALGDAALATGRFDTETPRQMMLTIYDLGLDQDLPRGENLYGHPDYWPRLSRMYEGYTTSADNSPALRSAYRTGYACAAYVAGQYDVARTQLEALDWRPVPSCLQGWDADLSLLSLLVAGHTGSHAGAVAEAERAWRARDPAAAQKIYREILAGAPDERTRELARKRLAESSS